MFKYDYLKIATVTPKTKIGHPLENVKEIIKSIQLVPNAKIILFPELSITGYSLGDWFFQNSLYNEFQDALKYLVDASSNQVLIVGGILRLNSTLLNVAYVIQNKHILGVVPKQFLPKSHEFNEPRYFMSGHKFMETITKCKIFNEEVPFGKIIFKANNYDISFGIEICGDLWNNYSPHIDLYYQGVDIVFNLSSSPFYVNKNQTRKLICKSASIKGQGAYVYTSTGASETSSDVIFASHQIAFECGIEKLNQVSFSFETIANYVDVDLEKIHYERLSNDWLEMNSSLNYQIVNYNLEESSDYSLEQLPTAFPFKLDEKAAQDIIDATSAALYKRLTHIGCETTIIGISGGLDSTLAFLFLVNAYQKYHLDLKKIIAVTMPGLATGNKTKSLAISLMEKLNVTSLEIQIKEEVEHHLALINHDTKTKDVTYENAQARYRTYLLMDLANKYNGIVIGTSDMSEIALGWSTFNGDQMAMYGLNSGIPKTAVKDLIAYFQKIYPNLSDELEKITKLPITPELTGDNQTTESIIGDYTINDFIMNSIFGNGYSKERIVYLLNKVFKLKNDQAINYYDNFMIRFKRNQFKRLTAPEGIKIFDFSMSPRSDYRFPGDMK